MFRIKKKGLHYIHKCIQCGLETKCHVNKVSACQHCNAMQRIASENNLSTAPIAFLMDDTTLWRMIYHLGGPNTKPS